MELANYFNHATTQYEKHAGYNYYLAYIHLSSAYDDAETMTPIPSFVRGFTASFKCIKDLGVLPPNLRYLDIQDSSIETLQDLPLTLESLVISNTKITQLPSLAHLKSLKVLNIKNCAIGTLPELPPNLDELNISGTDITELPVQLPRLTCLWCSDTSIKVLPSLPSCLMYLDVSNTQVVSLPELPPHLRNLELANTPITSLPEIPSDVEHFYLQNTKISTLPNLPSALGVLQISNTLVTSLPEIPELTSQIWANGITLLSIPKLPGGCTLHLDTGDITYKNQQCNFYEFDEQQTICIKLL